MALGNTLYDLTREKLGQAQLNLIDPILYPGIPPYALGLKLVLMDATYVADFSVTGDEFYSDLPALAIIAMAPMDALQFGAAPPTFIGGVLNADDVILTGVAATNINSIVIYQENGGANTTWPLIAYIDVGTGLPVTPSGSVTIQWNVLGIFKI